MVHGGAGEWPPDLRDAAATALERALEAGWKESGALDAAIAAVKVLEDDPLFNAGIGATFNADGFIEHDAGVMEGAGLEAGAVAAIQGVRHPVDLARAVLDDGRHVLLVGEGAMRFADQKGVERADPALFAVKRRSEQLERWRVGDTVGAVALDDNGHMAAACSTGGYTGKRPGRVGDSPIPGAGFYADDSAGASCCTGTGEHFIRLVTAFSATSLMAEGVSAMEAARRVIGELGSRLGGSGGIIVIDPRGEPGAAFNTGHMPWAARR